MLVNVERLNEFMEREGLDAVVATSPENVTYLSGYWALSQWIRRGPQTYVVWPAPGLGEPTIIASAGLLDLIADQDIWVEQIRRFGKFYVETADGQDLTDLERRQANLFELPDEGGPVEALIATLKGYGLEGGRIGFDEGGMPRGLEGKLRGELARADLRPAFELFRNVRAVKTPEEIRRLKCAANIAESSISAALALAKPGVTEREMGVAFHTRTVQEGALPVLGCIGFGKRSAMGNVQPSDQKLASGDVIRFDVGGRFQHYRADIARIACLGEPPAKVAQYHKALHAGVARAYEIIKPGASIADVFDEVVETVRREGLSHYRRSHVGHGIGLDGYDVPNLAPGSPGRFEEGMVLSVETPYYELGFAGLQVEDMVVVRSDHLESLMKTDGKLMII